MTGFSGRRVAVMGAGGQQGQTAVSLLLAHQSPPAQIVALDRAVPAEVAERYRSQGVEIEQVDILQQADALVETLQQVDLVVNFAGPFYRLGNAVMRAAIEADCHYVDICDDADTARELLALDSDAKAANVTALIGAGSAPGVTNVLGRMALDGCPGELKDKTLEISWVVPVTDVTESIFGHIYHSLASLVEGKGAFPDWGSLAPEPREFMQPLGSMETILFGHPEPATFDFCLGVETIVRGASVPENMMQVAWEVGVDLAKQEAEGQADFAAAYQRYSQAVQSAAPDSAREGWGGLRMQARGLDGKGVLIRTSSIESMADTTVGPCITFAAMLMEDKLPGAGVHSPEVLKPVDFFASLPRGSDTGETRAELFNAQGDTRPTSFRELLDPTGIKEWP